MFLKTTGCTSLQRAMLLKQRLGKQTPNLLQKRTLFGLFSSKPKTTINKNSIKIPKEGVHVFSWGDGSEGKLGLNSEDNSLSPVPIKPFSSTSIKQISSASTHTLALDQNGQMFGWGGNASAQLGVGDKSNSLGPIKVKQPKEKYMTYIDAGDNHCASIDMDGQLYTWGGNNSKTDLINKASGLGLGTRHFVEVPTLVEALRGVRIVQVSCGGSHTAAVSNTGEVFFWGKGDWGRLGHGDLYSYDTPKLIEYQGLENEKVKKVSLGKNYSSLLTENGKLFMFGKNEGHLGIETAATLMGGSNFDGLKIPTLLSFGDEDVRIADIACGESFTVACTEKGEVYVWGKHYIKPTKLKLQGHIVAVSSGRTHASFLQEDKRKIIMLGSNRYGQLGNGKSSGIMASAQEIFEIDQTVIPGKYLQVSCGGYFTTALIDLSN